MQFLVLAFAALAAASPLEKRQGPAALCPAIDTPQCCQLDVLGVAAVSCASRECCLLAIPFSLEESFLIAN